MWITIQQTMRHTCNIWLTLLTSDLWHGSLHQPTLKRNYEWGWLWPHVKQDDEIQRRTCFFINIEITTKRYCVLQKIPNLLIWSRPKIHRRRTGQTKRVDNAYLYRNSIMKRQWSCFMFAFRSKYWVISSLKWRRERPHRSTLPYIGWEETIVRYLSHT